MPTEKQFKQELQNGRMVESVDEMTDGYRETLERTLLVSGDTELMSAPAYYEQSLNAPTLNARASCVSVVQDELGHAHMDYRLLQDLGWTKEELLEREPHEFRNPYGFDQHLENFSELATAHGLFDRAGMVLLGDIHENTSFGSWKRALRKVDKEEQFHLLHGETWMRRFANRSDKTKEEVQSAVDWMFPMTVEWFGRTDDKKKHTNQLDYCIKGKTNDELRQEWLNWACETLEEMGLDFPAEEDDDGNYRPTYDFPVAFVEDDKDWRFDESISWDDAFGRWKDRGPANEKHTELLQQKL